MERKIVVGLICFICLQSIQCRSIQEETGNGQQPGDIAKTTGTELNEVFGTKSGTHPNALTDTKRSDVVAQASVLRINEDIPMTDGQPGVRWKRSAQDGSRPQRLFRRSRRRLNYRKVRYCLVKLKLPAEVCFYEAY
ncbi:hypothetical protein CAPTEDRAFT_191870 [Capitella teleta]|uniref:Uncharacterized protein n=1 Tax=Capitella teleta TaxID=283909 RepID=R7TY50_CAPTE|nr:hypothetical protein CAPTEDRAFT_191870 [Capitella teleta]|eukprot:ELT98813.1 hypothetical protein CAPTEDRAFT_191870 [Capitella teleta]